MQPQVNDTKFFFLASLFSLAIFSLFFFAFFYMMFYQTKIKTYGLTKKQYISVSLVAIKKSHQIQRKKYTQKKNTHSIKKVQKRSQVDPIDVGELFSNVKTKKVLKERKRHDANLVRELTKSTQITQNNNEKSSLTPSHLHKNSSSAEAVNKYLAKIHALVYEYFYPPLNTQNLVVKIQITISALGRLVDFKILQYSSSMELNHEAEALKERLKSVLFPKNPNHTQQTITIYLKPEDKE